MGMRIQDDSGEMLEKYWRNFDRQKWKDLNGKGD